MQEHKAWPASFGNSLYAAHNDDASAFEFLSATRCFLHLRSSRDDNSLDWHAQDEAAALSIGLETKGTSDPAYWMRTYYRHARTVFRRAVLLMEALPPARQSFYRPQRRKRIPIPGTDFVVQDGRIDVSDAELLTGPEGILRVFAMVAGAWLPADPKRRRPGGGRAACPWTFTSLRGRSCGMAYARSCSGPTPLTLCARCMPWASWSC